MSLQLFNTHSSGIIMETVLKIMAHWDDEAKVWVAYSDDVPGLATEAETIPALVEKLKVMVPEMLDENGYADGEPVIPFEVISSVKATTHRCSH